MKDLQLLRSLSKLTEARGEKEAFVAAMEVFKTTVTGHYYSALYGRVGCASVDLYHPDEGWLGIDSDIARVIALHHSSHPFSTDFFANARPAVYLRSQMVGEEEWRRTSIYQCLDSRLGIGDMIGLYFPVPSGQFGALFCGSRSLFRQSDFENARLLHMVLMPLLDNMPEVSPESAATPDELSPREHDVMNWLAQGKSNSDIGVMLGISQHTVRKHLEHIFCKLGVENRTAAAKEFREMVHWR